VIAKIYKKGVWGKRKVKRLGWALVKSKVQRFGDERYKMKG